jgi:ABC-type transport system substrate-binding protein
MRNASFCIVVALLVLVFAINLTFADFGISQLEGGPINENLVFKLCSSQGALFTGLVSDQVDVMCAPLSKSQYNQAIIDPNLQLAPVSLNDMYDLDMNNNRTIQTYPDWRSPTNYTEFRRAMAFCVDKDGLIANTVLGFGTRIDTPLPRRNYEWWVNFDVSKYGPSGELLDNYPYDYNTTKALEILYSNGWYNTTFYPSFTALKAAYDSGALEAAAGTDHGAIYPSDHEKAGEPADPLIGYARTDVVPRLELGRQVTRDLRKMGILVSLTEATSGVIYPQIYLERDFHFYTGGWDFGTQRFPSELSIYMSDQIYSGGTNYVCFSDPEYDYWADRFFNATSFSDAMTAALECQRVLVERAASVWVYSTKTYEAYRTGWLNMINMRGGYGFNNQWTYLFSHHEDYPVVNTTRVGIVQFMSMGFDPLMDPPNEVLESVFSHLMYVNPYKPNILGKSPIGGDLPWLAKDWQYWVDDSNRAHVEFALESGIVWHDGVEFTAYDVNYTIWLIKSTPASWYYPYVANVNETIIHGAYDIEVVFNVPSILSLYNVGLSIYVMPEHLPHVIDVGTGAWKYSPIGPSDEIWLVANRDFWLEPLIGEIDFAYFWNAEPFPAGGSYKIGLTDLVMLARAYGSSGNPPTANWEPGCDLATPSCVVGLTDLVRFASVYGRTWGEYDP